MNRLVFHFLLFFFKCPGDHRDLHSFPTRRSSDLAAANPGAVERLRRADDAPGERRATVGAGEVGLGDGEIRSEEHTSELQSRRDLVCRLLLEKKNKKYKKVLSTVLYNNL